MVSIILVDDHVIFSEGLTALLLKEPCVRSINTFTNPDELFRKENLFQIETNDELVVLLDINLGRIINGIDICKELKKLYPFCKVLALSMHIEHRYIRGMVDAGADGYILKNESLDVIVSAIKTVQLGDKYFSESVNEIIANAKKQEKLIENLNPRQKRVLELAIEGKTNKEIGLALHLSEKTIEYHKSGLYIKFDAKNITELSYLLKTQDV